MTKIIEENHALARRTQISGAPTFATGGRMRRGHAPLATKQAIVADERG